jgi:formate hydrogenlyase transcriptional activator
MTRDCDRSQRALLCFCQAIRSAHEVHVLFLQAAAAVHELTGGKHISLLPAPDGLVAHPGLAVEFADSPLCAELPAEDSKAPAVAWVLEHRQPKTVPRLERTNYPAGEQRLWDQGYQALLYLPLICLGKPIGALRIAVRREDNPIHQTLAVLEVVCTLLAVALDDLTANARAAELQRVQRENVYLRDEIKTDRDLRLLTGESRAMKAVRLAIQQVARTDSTVLILGETGTGKELVARAIHQLSARREHLLVAVNCAALAPGVIASELFGHEQGAFTGATKRRLGRFELAHRGTVFLDEIGELPPEMQVILLRVLQERAIERVGGHEPIAVDVRVLAATHQDLTATLNEGRFRADLFYRLNVFPIRVPPLRERREDIPDLVRHFLHRFGRRLNRPVAQVSPAALRALTEYHWPGNVRELENLVERAMIVATGDTLEVDPNWLRPEPPAVAVNGDQPGLANLERRAILEALERCHGKIYGPGGAAAALGLKPTTLYGKMRKHRIVKGATAE